MSAAAPSLMGEELPAVMVPSGENAGRSPASDSGVLSARTPSSAETTVSPLRPLTVTGTISSARRSAATAARWWEPAATRSWSLREMPSGVLWRSVERPMESWSKASVSPSTAMWSSTSTEPYCQPLREPMSRCGALLIDS